MNNSNLGKMVSGPNGGRAAIRKKCTGQYGCGEIKPISEFCRHYDKVLNICKSCEQQRQAIARTSRREFEIVRKFNSFNRMSLV